MLCDGDEQGKDKGLKDQWGWNKEGSMVCDKDGGVGRAMSRPARPESRQWSLS